MHHPQVLVLENDGQLAGRLHKTGPQQGYLVREIRQSQACVNALKRGGPGLLVLKIGRDLENELRLLQRISWQFPDSRTIVVGEWDHPALPDLAWDLGADYVLFPPTPLELLPELVARMVPRAGEK